MNAITRRMTPDEYSAHITGAFGAVAIGKQRFKPGEIMRALDLKGFMESLEIEGYVWECGGCRETHETEELAEACCFIEKIAPS